jgi:O-antigen/teichoic acid export membrane protein
VEATEVTTPGRENSSPPAEAAKRSELAQRALRGTAWTGASQVTGKLLFFLSTLLLARLLDQEDFGVAAYAITVTALVAAVPSLGLAPALIHYRDDEEILSTGFWLGLAAGLAAFVVMWTLAPLTEFFFNDPRAVGVTRALALLFPIEALRNVHAALLRRRLAFRLRFIPEFVQSLAKGVVAIALAIAGFGAWSLIGGSLAGAAAGAIAYWQVTSWRPTWRFDRASARLLLPFGGHVVTVDLLGAFVRNLDYLLVGRFLGATVLGVYVLAFRIPDLLIRNLSRMLGQVLLPLYATVKDDPEAIRDTFTASVRYLFALTAPMAVGMAILAEPLVSSLLSEKWIDVAPVIPPICAYALFISLSFNLGDLYKALGRPEALSRISLARACLAVPALGLAITVFGTAAAVGWAQAFVAFATMTVHFVVARRVFELPVTHTLLGLAPVAAATGLMGLATSLVASASSGQPAFVQLLLASSVGASVYIVSLRVIAPEYVAVGIDKLRQAFSQGGTIVESEG